MKNKFEADARDNAPGPEKNPDPDDESRIRPGESISKDDQRVGRKIKEKQPSDAEPGYANNDNLPNP